MARDYQRYIKKAGGKYRLPQAVYNAAIWQIRDYDRMREEAADIITKVTSNPAGNVKKQPGGDPVSGAAQKREKLLAKIKAIDEALELIPEEYQLGVWRNVQYREPFPDDAAPATYGRHKSVFVEAVALKLGLL